MTTNENIQNVESINENQIDPKKEFLNLVVEKVKDLQIDPIDFIKAFKKTMRGNISLPLQDEIKEFLNDSSTVVFAMNNDHLLYQETLDGWKNNPSSYSSKLNQRINWTDVVGILPIKVLGVSREGMIRYAAHGGSKDIRYMTFDDLKLCLPINYENSKVDVWRESIIKLDKSIKSSTKESTNKSSLSNLIFANDSIKNAVLNRDVDSLDSVFEQINVNHFDIEDDERA